MKTKGALRHLKDIQVLFGVHFVDGRKLPQAHVMVLLLADTYAHAWLSGECKGINNAEATATDVYLILTMAI